MIALLFALAGPVEWRAAAGAHMDSRPFLILDFGLRSGPWSAQLLTDTLDVRYDGSLKRGRWWSGLRAQSFAGGMQIAPWTDGAPAPERALRAGYLEASSGVQLYGPHGTYAGADYTARYWFFGRMPTTTEPAPAAETLLTPGLHAGIYRESIQAWICGGIDLRRGPLSPHLHTEVRLEPGWIVAPVIQLRAGVAAAQDDITRTRLGGSTPYAVPLAGAAWAEWWVEDYAAARAGVALHVENLVVHAVGDVAVFDDTDPVAGFAARTRWTPSRLFVEAELGWSPFIERSDTHLPLSSWLLVGVDWGAGRRMGPTE